MSKQVSGVVDFVGQKGKAWNVKVKGEWYGHGFKAPVFAKGDHITFTTTETPGRDGKVFVNVDPDTVKVTPKQAEPEKAPSVVHATKEDAKNYWDLKDRKITYGACRHDAVEIVKFLVDKEALPLPKTKNKQLDTFVKYVEEVAGMLFSNAINNNYEPTVVSSSEPAASASPVGEGDDE